jgi:hypothetical protein
MAYTWKEIDFVQKKALDAACHNITSTTLSFESLACQQTMPTNNDQRPKNMLKFLSELCLCLPTNNANKQRPKMQCLNLLLIAFYSSVSICLFQILPLPAN